MERWQVVVVGAGAAGLLAAARAAERGLRTLLLEKNRRPGIKILMSGGTRCNITHHTDRRGIVKAYGRQGAFLHSALAALSPQEVVALMEAEGVATKVEETGKIFPVSDKATDVADALVRRLERSGAVLALEEPVLGIEPLPAATALADQLPAFHIRTNRRELAADDLVVCTGGQSYPGSGTTGDGYAWLTSLGHNIVTPRPALVPITTPAQWVQALKGVTIPDVVLRLFDPELAQGDNAAANRKKAKNGLLDEHRGSFLFTHFGLSGPTALNISREITGHPQPHRLILECDLLPAVSEGALEESLRKAAASDGKKHVVNLLPEQLPRRLNETLLDVAGVPADRRAAELSKAERAALVQAVKRLPLPVSGTRGFKKAEVTAGGVALGEVDSRTMQSKLVPHLYLAGEILDLDGPIGGFNFQAAFSTGYLAGQSVGPQEAMES